VLVLLVILAVLWNINQRLVWIERSVRGTNSMLSKRSYARISLCRTPRCLPSFNGI
jgi:hypothetical protein